MIFFGNSVNINSSDYDVYHSALTSKFIIPNIGSLHKSYSDPSDIVFYKKTFKGGNSYQDAIENKDIVNISLKGLYGKSYKAIKVGKNVSISGKLTVDLSEEQKIIRIDNFKASIDNNYLYDTDKDSILEFRFMDNDTSIESKIRNRNYQCGKVTSFFKTRFPTAGATNDIDDSLLRSVIKFFESIGIIEEVSTLPTYSPYQGNGLLSNKNYKTINPVDINTKRELRELVLYALKLIGFDHYITFETK